MYQTTAFLYDAIAAFEEPDKVAGDIHTLLGRCGITQPGLIGDLGSGTGIISIPLATLGWNIHGIELSRTMLDVAESKRCTLKQEISERITWVSGDIRCFELPENIHFDSVVCMCNTVNHLVERADLEGFIQSVCKAIKPGGILIFDSDTLGTFHTFFHHGPTVVWDDGTHRMTRSCEFDADWKRAYHRTVLEAYKPGGLTFVSEEAMTLQYYAEPDLHAAFTNAEFEMLASLPYNPNPKLYGGMIPKFLWVFRKPAQAV